MQPQPSSQNLVGVCASVCVCVSVSVRKFATKLESAWVCVRACVCVFILPVVGTAAWKPRPHAKCGLNLCNTLRSGSAEVG